MIFSCSACGRVFNLPDSAIGPIRCFCSYVTASVSTELITPQAAPVVSIPNAWDVIHQRLARAIINGQWDAATEQAWYRSEWLPAIPHCGACLTHWEALTTQHPIDWSTAETAFNSFWFLHNEVSRLHSGQPTLTLEEAFAKWLVPQLN